MTDLSSNPLESDGDGQSGVDLRQFLSQGTFCVWADSGSVVSCPSSPAFRGGVGRTDDRHDGFSDGFRECRPHSRYLGQVRVKVMHSTAG
jgi:hypothetical protein